MSVPADLIVYALVAAGLVFWLRNILGTRSEDDPQRPNPFVQQPEELSDISQKIQEHISPARTGSLGAQDHIIALAQNKNGPLSIDNKTAENRLLEISKADKDFDVNLFLDGAQNAFALIVEAFATGERETLKNLLSKAVYNTFESAIIEREKRGEIQETQIHTIRKATILDACMKNKSIFITVSFTAEETSVTKDESGEIIAGHPDKTSDMHDIWTFGREIGSSDPRWLVFETRSDHEDDNELLPNSH